MLYEVLEITVCLAIALIYWHEHKIDQPWRGRLIGTGHLLIALVLASHVILVTAAHGVGGAGHAMTWVMAGPDGRGLV